MQARCTLAFVVAVAALVFGGSAAAHAAQRPLPVGDALYAIDCDGAAPTVAYRVEPADARAVALSAGNALAHNDCPGQGAWNPVTGDAFFVSGAGSSVLVRLDLANGASAEVGEFSDATGPVAIAAMTIASDGSAFAFTPTGMRYVLDLGSGQLTLPTALHGLAGATPFGITELTAAAIDPRTSAVFVVDAHGHHDDNYLYQVESDGWLVPVVQLFTAPGATVTSLQCDTNGVCWHLADGSALWSMSTSWFNLANAQSSGSLALRSGSLLIAPARALELPSRPEAGLPATGVDDALDTMTGLGAIVLTLGLVLLGVGVRRRPDGARRRP